MKRIFLLVCIIFNSNLVWSAPILDPEYERLFPNYAEFCGFGKMNGGNIGGHAFLYLKGVCPDPDGDRPLVRRCSAEELQNHPEVGTALSVNPVASNAQWFAIEDLNYVLYGDVPFQQPIDTPTYEKILDRALEKHIYRNILPTSSLLQKKPIETPAEKYLAAMSLGTDFGIALAREGSCWKLPISSEQVDLIVHAANRINLEIDSKHPAHFDFLSDNCVHFAVNLLAAAGILDSVSTRLPFPIDLGSIDLPTSRMLQIGRKVRERIPSVQEAFENPLIHKALTQFHRLPIPYGAILENTPFHERGNYDFEKSGRFAFPGELERLNRMEEDPKFTDLRTHLQIYQAELNQVQTDFQATPLETLVAGKYAYTASEFTTFYELYKEWLHQTSIDLDTMLRSLL